METQILNDFSTSYWLKDAIKSTAKRDILDALYDAEALLLVLRERCKKAGLKV